MSALDELQRLEHLMLGARNQQIRDEIARAERETIKGKEDVEREDRTVGNEEILRGLPLFLNGKLPLGGAIQGSRPGDPARHVDEIRTSMPRGRMSR